jgi:hypothetical protein
VWSSFSVDLNEIFSTDMQLFGLSSDRQELQRLIFQPWGPRRTLPTWVTVSGPIRQFHDGYILSPDGSEAALILNNGSKKVLGGPFARLYGKYPYLYATDFDSLDVYSYNINTQSWLFTGQP